MSKKPSKIIETCKESMAAINKVKANNPAIVLSREQINKLTEIVNHFPEINHFTLQVDSSSGIGPGVHVKFDLFGTDDVKVDITDVTNW